eukprot:CAMPEP_0114304610 /NCGR_PEP_ID=MMETSP0059-20121206/15884_1 /TAXON_ID=36894 /ORGANISM="Pyramimonas parkeae, Strain CCMP726" /LENGTH=382 /DNA_ID=CAMNT_0001427731 /DNA_START=102 /DNA_END=1250 /DNA_ORIENTATION=+
MADVRTIQAPQEAASTSHSLVQPLSDSEVHANQRRGRRRPAWLRMSEGCSRLLSGGMSAIVARTVVAPLERVKMDFQIRSAHPATVLQASAQAGRGASLATFSKHVGRQGLRQSLVAILKAEGLRGLWKGNGVNLIRTAPYKATNFYVFDTLHDLFLRRSGKESLSNAERCAAGAGAGVFFPLDVVRTRLMAHEGFAKMGVVGGLRAIVRREGPGGLYRGVLPALVSMVPNGAVFYSTYDVLKTAAFHHKKLDASARSPAPEPSGAPQSSPQQEQMLAVWQMLLFGAISGAASEASTYPLDLVRRRLQIRTGIAPATDSLARMLSIAQQIVAREGPRGLYAGLAPSVLQVLPSAALSYFTYETAKAWLGAHFVKEEELEEAN